MASVLPACVSASMDILELIVTSMSPQLTPVLPWVSVLDEESVECPKMTPSSAFARRVLKAEPVNRCPERRCPPCARTSAPAMAIVTRYPRRVSARMASLVQTAQSPLVPSMPTAPCAPATASVSAQTSEMRLALPANATLASWAMTVRLAALISAQSFVADTATAVARRMARSMRRCAHAILSGKALPVPNPRPSPQTLMSAALLIAAATATALTASVFAHRAGMVRTVLQQMVLSWTTVLTSSTVCLSCYSLVRVAGLLTWTRFLLL